MTSPATVRKASLNMKALAKVNVFILLRDCYILFHPHLIFLDIDECAIGSIDIYGHYCPRTAKCINTLGGFTCQCPAGYKFIDRGGFASFCQSTPCSVMCYCTLNVLILTP